MAPREPRFDLLDIMIALLVAGIEPPVRQRVFDLLVNHRPKRGRKPEDDDDLVSKVLALAQPGVTFNAAAAQVVRGLPDSQREAARKRLARKAKMLWEATAAANLPEKS